MMRFAAVLVVALGCGSVKRPFDDAAVLDDDAQATTPPQVSPTPSRELVNSAGRLTSASFTLDVEIGHAVAPRAATSVTYRIEVNAAVTSIPR